MNINKENINLIHVDVFKSKDDLTWSLIFVNVKILKKQGAAVYSMIHSN